MEASTLKSNNSGFQLAEGIEVSSLEGISEGYSEDQTEEGYHLFTVNVSAENIPTYFLALSQMVGEPAYFVVEVPVDEAEEQQLRQDETDPFHKAVYYLDGIDYKQAEAIFRSHQRLFVHDGMVNFGFGSQQGYDEVFVGEYKIFTIFADSPEKYRKTLAQLGVPFRPELRTVWDNFTQDTPGRRSVLREKPTIWDMLEQMKLEGFYYAETRED